MHILSITLPWPPTANTYWRHPGKGALAGRHLISEPGRSFRRTVDALVVNAGLAAGLLNRLRVSIVAYPPDRRRRDLDNLLKPLLDALQHAGMYEDDSQIDALSITRGHIIHAGGQICVGVSAIQESCEEAWRKVV